MEPEPDPTHDPETSETTGGTLTGASLMEIRYINISALKVAIADWHRQAFEQAEDGYSMESFFREQFLDAFGHSDAVYVQLAAAFDALACSIAHRIGLPQSHKADFAGWNEKLAANVRGGVRSLVESTASESGFERLMSYRNAAVHRSITTGKVVLAWVEDTNQNEVRFVLGDPPPIGVPDSAGTQVREILRRDLGWARDALYALYPAVLKSWGLTDHEQLRGDLGLRGETKAVPSMMDRAIEIPVFDSDFEDESG